MKHETFLFEDITQMDDLSLWLSWLSEKFMDGQIISMVEYVPTFYPKTYHTAVVVAVPYFKRGLVED